jgi:cellulose synthase/poly-beta-1,6-N-acetylglucosamine synthase-like glycosyltransferase
MMESVTILSTVKNIKETVEIWLNSLLNLEYNGRIDIVIIDSYSTDGTKEILEKYSKKYDEIKVIEYRSSQPEALNYAVENNRLNGKFIALIDGDCIAPPDWIKNLVGTLNNENVDAIGGPGLTPRDVNFFRRIIGLDLDARFLSTPRGLVKRHPNMNMLIKKTILEKLKFNTNLKVGYDTDFGYRLNSARYKLFYEPTAFVYHYHRSTMRDYIKQQFKTGKYAIKFYSNRKNAIKGDNINPIWMTTQPIFFVLFAISIFFSLFNSFFISVALIFLSMLFTDFTFGVYSALKVKKDILAIALYLLYSLRIIPWLCGAIMGIVQRRSGR